MTFLAADEGQRHQRHSSDARQFRLLVTLTFPIFLIVVLATTLIGKRPPSVAGNRLSVFAEAKAAATTAIAIGFMG